MSEFFVQLPYSHRYGPYSYPEDEDIASDLQKLSEASEPPIAGTSYRVKLPKNLRDYILVAVYPFSGAARPPFSHGEETAAEPAVVYGVRCSQNERLSEEEIRNRLQTTNGSMDVIGERYLCVAVDSDPAQHDEDLFSRKYGRGTVLVARNYNSNSDSYTPLSAGIPTNLPQPQPPFDARQGHTSLTAPSEQYESDAFVTPNQNLIVPDTPIMRKIESTLDGPTQALMPDFPHLEQKPPLRNLGDLAGGTTLHSVLVTPSNEQQSVLGGPLPCKDKLPTVVIKVTSEGDGKEEEEEEKEERRDEIVRPEAESSRSVSSPIPNSESLLSCYRRQGSLSSGENLVAPRFQISHIGMVTGRTLSLPPNDQQSKSEKDTEVGNLPVVSSSNLLRTKSDLSTILLRKNSDSNLLLNCGTPHIPVDDDTNEQGRKSTRRRRSSMSDMGIQQQDSGGGLNEAVITGAGASKLVNANRKAPHVSTTILEHSVKEDSKITEQLDQDDVQTSVADLLGDLCSRRGELREESAPLEIRPMFRIGSLNRSNSREDPTISDKEDREVQQREVEHRSEIVLNVQHQGGTVDSSLPLEKKNAFTRGTRQQVHIMEHVYNGNCVLKDDCPEPPTPENLRQMSSIIEAHRNGVVSPLTDWLKELIRTHCSRCRDACCKVPHMAVGCPPPGAVQYSSSSSGSPICSSPPRSPPPSSSSTSAPLFPDQMHCQQPKGIRSVSVDLFGRNSTTSQVREYYRDDHLPADSAHHLEQRGTNYADSPHARLYPRFGGEFPITQGTPPDEENPMIFAGSNTHYGHRMLPGDRRGSRFAPVTATTNEGPYQPMGYQQPRMLGSHMTDHMMHAPHRTPIQQESAYENTGVPDRRQTCYIQPSRKVNLQEQSRDPSDSELPDVHTGGFPHSSRYAKVDEGVLIYCSERLTDLTGFVLGTTCCPPNQQKADFLGHGGNGRVYSYYQNDEIFALKRTTYRPCELQAWFKLDHPNVLPLLGVMWGGAGGHSCYQLMPRMTSDLSTVMRSVGDLCTLVGNESGDQWEKVMRHNVRHVVKGLVEGVRYLHNQGIQHYDLKAGNILINKRDSCHCPNIFKCECPLKSKCEIRIADFDSIKTFIPGRSATLIPDSPSEPKPAGTKVLGTPFYRAPEQFKQYTKDALKDIPRSQQQHGLEGPWCDMWAVGVILTQLCLGKDRAKERKIVCNTMMTSTTTNTTSGHPTPEVEGLVARERLSTLREKCINCYQLAPLADIAMLCLEPDFKKRITADKLLKNHFFL